MIKSAFLWLWCRLTSLSDERITFARWEMFLMRAAFAGLVLWSMGKNLPPDSQPLPNGLCVFLDLTWLAQPETWAQAQWITAGFLACFVFGLSGGITLLVPVFFYVAMGSLINSQGAIKHHSQLIAMTLIALWLSTMVACLWKAIRSRRFAIFDDVMTQRIGIQWAMIAIAAAYVTSAFSKLLATEGTWIFRTPNLAVELVKSHLTVFHDTITTSQIAEYPPLAAFLVDHVWLAPILFGPGLFIELFFFLALAGRGWAAVFGMGAILMHVIITLVMKLVFPEHEALMLIFFVNIPFWTVVFIRGAWRKI